jgi:hypothetical protein
MNETIETTASSLAALDKVAADLLLKLPEIMNSGTEYGMDLFHRFITYVLLTEGIALFIWSAISLIIIFTGTIKKIHKVVVEKHSSEDWGGGPWFFLYFLYFIPIITVLSMFESISTIIQIIFVPELYLINYFS